LRNDKPAGCCGTAAGRPVFRRSGAEGATLLDSVRDTGYSYDVLLGDYLTGAKEVVVEDPYIRHNHQINNFVRFCEAVVRRGTC